MAAALETRSSDIQEAPVLDWSKTPLADVYPGYYAKIIDDVFTPAECDALIALAQSDGKQFTQAYLNFGMGANDKFMDLDFRNSDRILRFDKPAADQIYQRLLPYISEITALTPGHQYWERVATIDKRQRLTWKLVGVNERLSYLRYGEGQYFREHVDTFVELPDGRKSLFTIQIYLGEDGVEGGATRLQEPRGGERYIDVEPKKGRVLIFQQAHIRHSGEDVVKGNKYTLRSDLMYVKESTGSS
ncbi:hypothetical protein NMY22_g4856 [Coprinellus aureogranulatus]|nr:hypothetical protein NMY22_g4856 [Coprinellus aureogranulatus]